MSGEGQSGYVGQLSSDGKWRWDGTAWQTVEATAGSSQIDSTAAPTAFAASPLVAAQASLPLPIAAAPKKRRGWVGYAAVAVVALIVGAVCGSAVSSSSTNQSSSSQSTSSPLAATSAVPLARELASTYANVTLPHETALSAAASKMGTDCTNENISTCRSDANAVSSQARSFLDDLGKLTVPACLSATNLELGTALELYIDGDNAAVAGIDANDANEIEQGAQLITLGTSRLNKATDLLSAHPCG